MSGGDRLHRRGRNAGRLILSSCLLLPAVAPAQTGPRTTVDVSVNGVADSNPFLETDGESTLSANIQIDPKIYWEDETSSATLDGSLRVSQYLERYGNDIGGRIGAQGRKKLDTRTSLSASAGFQSSRSTLQDFILGNSNGSLDPVILPEVAFSDVTITGRRTRVMTLDAYAGLDHVISEADSVNIYGATSYSKFGGVTESDYRTGTLGLRYRRRLSERTNATAGATATVADYIGVNSGDARIFNPEIGIENQLNERLIWTANLGVSIASIDDEQQMAHTKTYLTGSVSLCDKGVKSSFCGSLARSAQPTAFGGLRAVTNVAFTYERQLTLKDRLAVSGRFGRTGQSSIPALTPLARTTSLYGLSAMYTKDMNERFAFVVSPSFTKAVEKGFRNESNYSLMVGVRLRLGKLR